MSATAKPVTIQVTRTSPADNRQRTSVLPAGSTAKTLITALSDDPCSPHTVVAATAFADTDVIQMVITGTQADLKVLGL